MNFEQFFDLIMKRNPELYVCPRGKFIADYWHHGCLDAPVSLERFTDDFREPVVPSWGDAPAKANWLAQDACGDWYWYLNRPVLDGDGWGPGPFRPSREACLKLCPPNPHGYRYTLQQRPEQGGAGDE